MKKLVPSLCLAATFLFAGNASALLVSGPDIISAPASVADDPPSGAVNTAQQAFNEKQGVALLVPLLVDGGSIAAGTVVDSHMIFLNTASGSATDLNVTWAFDGTVLGVMSDGLGALEAASNLILGAAGTSYPGAFSARGLESNDSYSVSGNSITVSMRVSEPGDWIRVVTASRVPDAGATAALMGLGCIVVGLFSRRRK